jgi:D-alanyl-lipoteichoic acid acyltransferase DltB (MBOAT superfamily)
MPERFQFRLWHIVAATFAIAVASGLNYYLDAIVVAWLIALVMCFFIVFGRKDNERTRLDGCSILLLIVALPLLMIFLVFAVNAMTDWARDSRA